MAGPWAGPRVGDSIRTKGCVGRLGTDGDPSPPEALHVTVLAAVDVEMLSRLSFSEGFRVFFGGETRMVRAMLNGVASAPGGRVTVALDGGDVVGFLCLLPPMAGDRFNGLEGVVELAAIEVVGELRGRGIFRAMFEAAFGGSVEDSIAYAVGGTGFRDEGESARSFRRRTVAVFRSLGFFPMPTDYLEAHLRRDSVFLVLVGDRVPRERLEAFVDRVHGNPWGGKAKVAIALRNGALRNLVRADLERSGFEVVSVSAEPSTGAEADVVVTEFPEMSGPLTVRVVDGDSLRSNGSTVWLPVTELTRLPDVIRGRSETWRRASSAAS